MAVQYRNLPHGRAGFDLFWQNTGASTETVLEPKQLLQKVQSAGQQAGIP